jgi:hypothetical protein
MSIDTDRYYDVEDNDYIHIDDHNREMDYLESRLSELEGIENFYLSEERCILEELFTMLDLVTNNEPRQTVLNHINYIINLHSKDLVNEFKFKRLEQNG